VQFRKTINEEFEKFSIEYFAIPTQRGTMNKIQSI